MIIVLMILIPLFNKLNRKHEKDKHSKESSTIDENHSYRKGDIVKIENDNDEFRLKTRDYLKLLLKSKPFGIFAYIFYSNICTSLVLQIIIYRTVEKNIFLIGPLSTFLVYPISLLQFYLRSQKNQYLSFLTPSLLIVASTVTVFFLGGFENWFISMIIGFLSELICIQLVAISYINSCKTKI